MIGTNPRKEAPVLNARIRKAWLRGAEVAAIGEGVDLTYDYTHLGEGADALSAFEDSDFHKNVFSKAEHPLIVLGAGATAREDGAALLGAAMALAESHGAIKDGWTGFSVLQTAASRVGGLEIGFVPGEGGRDTSAILDGADSGEIEAVYLLGADEIDMNRLGGTFVIYQGHHGDAGANRADVILPAAAYTEQSGLFVNTEGRPQMAYRAAFPPGDAKEDWAIVRALSERLGDPLPFDSIGQLHAQIFEAHSHLARIDAIEAASWQAEPAGSLGDAPLRSPVEDFYLTNPIARASETMAACSRLAREKSVPLAAE